MLHLYNFINIIIYLNQLSCNFPCIGGKRIFTIPKNISACEFERSYIDTVTSLSVPTTSLFIFLNLLKFRYCFIHQKKKKKYLYIFMYILIKLIINFHTMQRHDSITD